MLPLWLTIAVVATSGAVLLLFVILGARRITLLRQQRHRQKAGERLRTAAVELVAGGIRPENVPERDTDLLAEVLWNYSRQLTGEARDEIAAYFEEVGLVDRQLRALSDRRAWRRAQAAYSLGDACSTRAVPALVELLNDPDLDVRTAALRSLGRLRAGVAVAPIAATIADRRLPLTLAGSVLLEMGAPAEALYPLATTAPEAVRSLAVDLIGRLGDAADSTWLKNRVTDESPLVRAALCLALSRLGAQDAVTSVRILLADPDPTVRAAAATALGELGERDDELTLLGTARHDSFEPAQAAAAALALIAPELLLSAVGQPDAGPHLHQAADQLAVPGQ